MKLPTMRKIRKVMRVARNTRQIPTDGKSMSFERYVLRFDQLNGLKSTNYTFGEKK